MRQSGAGAILGPSLGHCRKEAPMSKARHLIHEAELSAALAIALVIGLAFVDAALAAVVAIMLAGAFVLVVPLASILFDERQGHRPRR
jgi:hypothetical protein